MTTQHMYKNVHQRGFATLAILALLVLAATGTYLSLYGASKQAVKGEGVDPKSAIATFLQYKGPFTVAYTITGDPSPGEGSELHMVADEHGVFRFDIQTTKPQFKTSVWEGGEKNVVCVENAGVSRCAEGAKAGPTTNPLLVMRTRLHAAATVTTAPPRTVAGVSTSCFTATHADDFSEICFSKDGVPLYMNGGNSITNGKVVFTATTFDEKADAALLVPPVSR